MSDNMDAAIGAEIIKAAMSLKVKHADDTESESEPELEEEAEAVLSAGEEGGDGGEGEDSSSSPPPSSPVAGAAAAAVSAPKRPRKKGGASELIEVGEIPVLPYGRPLRDVNGSLHIPSKARISKTIDDWLQTRTASDLKDLRTELDDVFRESVETTREHAKELDAARANTAAHMCAGNISAIGVVTSKDCVPEKGHVFGLVEHAVLHSFLSILPEDEEDEDRHCVFSISMTRIVMGYHAVDDADAAYQCATSFEALGTSPIKVFYDHSQRILSSCELLTRLAELTQMRVETDLEMDSVDERRIAAMKDMLVALGQMKHDDEWLDAANAALTASRAGRADDAKRIKESVKYAGHKFSSSNARHSRLTAVNAGHDVHRAERELVKIARGFVVIKEERDAILKALDMEEDGSDSDEGAAADAVEDGVADDEEPSPEEIARAKARAASQSDMFSDLRSLTNELALVYGATEARQSSYDAVVDRYEKQLPNQIPSLLDALKMEFAKHVARQTEQEALRAAKRAVNPAPSSSSAAAAAVVIGTATTSAAAAAPLPSQLPLAAAAAPLPTPVPKGAVPVASRKRVVSVVIVSDSSDDENDAVPPPPSKKSRISPSSLAAAAAAAAAAAICP
jgi:ElaB/YqjD/DUF883 family membrane-anchored ribosome-binding protein